MAHTSQPTARPARLEKFGQSCPRFILSSSLARINLARIYARLCPQSWFSEPGRPSRSYLSSSFTDAVGMRILPPAARVCWLAPASRRSSLGSTARKCARILGGPVVHPSSTTDAITVVYPPPSAHIFAASDS
ncbi:hypothetical protein BDW22DRAFT_1361381 [Trametopsis cervina]|nr:hypothetical protein BDW22DRAFT_1361381 [Trametopsis cervina]